MTLPLARLSRPPGHVLLVEAFAQLDVPGASRLRRVPLASAHDAIAFLRVWKSDRDAAAQLREALRRHRPRPLHNLDDDEVISGLAQALASGAIVAFEEVRPASLPIAFEAPGAGAAAAAGAAVPAAALPKELAPGTLATRPILPLLEEVRIEGAEVLPEVLQTLERIDAGLGAIDLASVSLEPTPTGVAQIGDAMKQASESVGDTLGGL